MYGVLRPRRPILILFVFRQSHDLQFYDVTDFPRNIHWNTQLGLWLGGR